MQIAVLADIHGNLPSRATGRPDHPPPSAGQSPLQRANPFPLWNDPEFYAVSKADSRAFGTGHLDLAVVEHIPSVRLVFDQFVRFDNLNPPGAHRSTFRIVLNASGDVHELEYEVV